MHTCIHAFICTYVHTYMHICMHRRGRHTLSLHTDCKPPHAGCKPHSPEPIATNLCLHPFSDIAFLFSLLPSPLVISLLSYIYIYIISLVLSYLPSLISPLFSLISLLPSLLSSVDCECMHTHSTHTYTGPVLHPGGRKPKWPHWLQAEVAVAPVMLSCATRAISTCELDWPIAKPSTSETSSSSNNNTEAKPSTSELVVVAVVVGRSEGGHYSWYR